MRSESFSLIPQPQEPGHCGPTSLSSCLTVLGIQADQRELARAMNKPYRTYREGVDEFEIRKAARRYGVRTEFLARFEREKGPLLSRRLRRWASRGLPAILLVDDFEHWVALLGYLEERAQFIVMDPDDRHHAFNRWSEHTLLRRGWNSGGVEPDQYFAILARRRDDQPPRWHITEAFLRLCEVGSAQTSEEMANDLIEMARRARSETEDEDPGPFLDEVLSQHRKVILSSVEHWAAYNRRRHRDLRAIYSDYATIAGAAGIRIGRRADPTAIVAQMTTVLTTYAWTGAL
jgi:hypothetical protein